jgi:hypothetical protein
MKLAELHPKNPWAAESGMTGLLLFILGYIFVVCALGDFPLGIFLAHLLFALIIVAGVFSTFRQRWVRFCSLFLAVAILSLNWWEYFHPMKALALLNTALNLVFLGFLLSVVIPQVFQAGPVTSHRIRGAIVVYLLLGGAWSLSYHIMALTIPHAFHFPEGLAPATSAALQRELTYFSFVTLTTTGYGDIIPTHPLTRTLAIFEALLGQLYLVITLARLVSLAVLGYKEDQSK